MLATVTPSSVDSSRCMLAGASSVTSLPRAASSGAKRLNWIDVAETLLAEQQQPLARRGVRRSSADGGSGL